MHPRLIFRTHYQVGEPAYIEFLVRFCTSPVQSSYREVVEEKLKREIRERAHTEFNIAAAGYCADLGLALGVINQNNVWTDKGHLVDLIAETNSPDELALTDREKLLHFRLFLEADGAVLLEIAKYYQAHETLKHSEAVSARFIDDIFERILSDYLKTSSSTAERMELRAEISKLTKVDYRPKTRKHKLLLHLQTLFRLGLVSRTEPASMIEYRVTESQRAQLGELLAQIPNIQQLESRIEQRELITVAAFVLRCRHFQPQADSTETLGRIVARLYLQVKAHGTPLCSISTLTEATQIRMLTETQQLLKYDEILAFLKREQDAHPRDIAFHVDRMGRPAFVKFSEEWLGAASHEPAI